MLSSDIALRAGGLDPSPSQQPKRGGNWGSWTRPLQGAASHAEHTAQHAMSTVHTPTSSMCGAIGMWIKKRRAFVGTNVSWSVKTRGFVGPDVRWTVQTGRFEGPDVRWTVKTQGFVGRDVRGTVKTRGFVDPSVWVGDELSAS